MCSSDLFVVDELLARRLAADGALAEDREPVAEVRDTFGLYGPRAGERTVWLTEPGFAALPAPTRTRLVRSRLADDADLVPSVRAWGARVAAARRQADGHRFVWWPSTLAGLEAPVLTRYVEAGRRTSRHLEVPDAVWSAAADAAPRARELAGRFPAHSGPNCFGAVMAATGVPGADLVWMQREPFEEWLAARTRPGGSDAEPGTVLVWRSPDSAVQHAALTLGGGWALHKPSQGWMSPTKVLGVAQCLASARASGRRLERRSLVA